MNTNYIAYYNFIKSIYPLPKKDFELLLGHSKGRQVNAKTILVELGKNPDTMYLLVKGVVRSYFLLENGKEVTKTLFSDMELCSSLSALIKSKPSEIVYETLTECFILELNYFEFKELCTSNIEVLNLYVNYLESNFIKNEEKHLEILSLSGKERYLALRNRIPNIDNLIPQYQIAAYLNITPVQLSRIRSSL